MPRISNFSSSSIEIVLGILRKNTKPLGAYEILEKARKFGIKSPPIVYRALDNLVGAGKVHRINELNSFVACDCKDDHQHLLSILTICQKCSEVSEIHDQTIIEHLTKLVEYGINFAENAVMEIPIICKKCLA